MEQLPLRDTGEAPAADDAPASDEPSADAPATPSAASEPSPPAIARTDSRIADKLFNGATAAAGILVLLLPATMIVQLVFASRLSLARFGGSFLTNSTWDPVRLQFGAWPFIFGTVVSSVLALIIAVPVALGVAIFLAEMCPHRVRKPLGFLVELLAAIPSVVYGFWGIFVLVPLLREKVQPFLGDKLSFLPFFQGPPLGFGMLAAGLILAIMIVPTITSISREVMLAIPNTNREAAIGLGATPWDTIRYAVLPLARSGIVGAIILGLGRALGETMAVTMVIGNRPKASISLFEPAYSMASVIANEFAEADSDVYLSALSEIALLLFGVALLLNLFARWLVRITKGRVEQTA